MTLIIKIIISSLLITISKSEIIEITLCSDNSCSSSCKSWSPRSGDCFICNEETSICSATNPSSITTSNSLTLYSDNLCKTIIPNTNKMPINSNAQCNILYGNNGISIGSYKVTNIPEEIIGGIIVLLIICLFICCYCYRKKYRQQNIQNENTNAVIVLDSQQPYTRQPYIQQPYTQQPYTQQPFSQQPYSQQAYPPTYSQPSYYPPPSYEAQTNKVKGTTYKNLDSIPPNPSAPPEQSISYFQD
jgi:hypothetical protein